MIIFNIRNIFLKILQRLFLLLLSKLKQTDMSEFLITKQKCLAIRKLHNIDYFQTKIYRL